VLRITAQPIQQLHAEVDELGGQLTRLVDAAAPWLVDLPGVGPVTAAQVLVSWSYAGRLRSEAAFAAWPGPVRSRPRPGRSPATGPDRCGDRQLNRALHTIVIARLRDDPDTRAYAARRTAQGKTPREIRRCLKRFTARQLFKLLERYDQPGIEVLRAA
jgi:transposase